MKGVQMAEESKKKPIDRRPLNTGDSVENSAEPLKTST